MTEQSTTMLATQEDMGSAETRLRDLELFFSQADFPDILCDGKCTTCLQREWCLLTPVSRYVK